MKRTFSGTQIYSLVFGAAAVALTFALYSPPARAQTDSGEPRVGAEIYDKDGKRDVKGGNVEAVIYSDGSSGGKIAGAFVKTGRNRWIEQNAAGRSSYREIAHDEWSVYLRETSSDQEIQLNLFPRVYVVSEIDYENREVTRTLHRIVQTINSKGSRVSVKTASAVPMADHVKGVNAKMAILASGRDRNLFGVFLQSGPDAWLAKTQSGAHDYSEVKRDEWSIYLRRDRDGEVLQVDLYDKAVAPFDIAANRKSGPPQFEVLTAFATSPSGPPDELSKVTKFWIGSNPADENLVFEAGRGGVWKEYRKNGAEFAGDWQEKSRDASSVTLYDARRDYWLRLTESKAMIKTDRGPWRLLIYGRWSETPPPATGGKYRVTVVLDSLQIKEGGDGPDDAGELYWTISVLRPTPTGPASEQPLSVRSRDEWFSVRNGRTYSSAEISPRPEPFEVDAGQSFVIRGWVRENDDFLRGGDDHFGDFSQRLTAPTAGSNRAAFSVRLVEPRPDAPPPGNLTIGFRVDFVPK